MKKRTLTDWIAWTLVVAGALNWGLLGTFDVNLVEKILGLTQITQFVYILVGMSGLYLLWLELNSKK